MAAAVAPHSCRCVLPCRLIDSTLAVFSNTFGARKMGASQSKWITSNWTTRKSYIGCMLSFSLRY